MSYDLRIWSSKELSDDSTLLAEKGYQENDDCFIREGKGWQVVINQTDDVEPEDIPDEIMQALPGIAYLTEINIEGDAPEKTVGETLRFCKALAKEIRGIVEDPQTDTIFLPAGMKKISYENISKDDKQEVFLTWYIDDVETFYSTKLEPFIDLLERLMPDALPKRYGEYEPPQFKLAEKGKEHLIGFLQKEGYAAVLYPSRPFKYLFLTAPNIEQEAREYFERGLDKRKIHPDSIRARVQKEYRCGTIELQMLQNVFLQPDWNLAVKRLFIETAKLLQPFFAEISACSEEKILRKQNFVRTWWWRGLPRNLGYAAILNDTYINQWAKFRKIATEIDDSLWMVDNFGQTEYINIMKKVGKVPRKIIAPKKEKKAAAFFPFQKGIAYRQPFLNDVVV
jgi:hypothetical protein